MQSLKQAKNNPAWLLIFLGWIVYTSSYLGKVNYSANITQIIDFYEVTKAQAGLAPTFFFFAYGVGQVFNGLFCKKYNIKWVIFCSLMLSGIINLIIALTSNFHIIKWLWLINGFSLSVLWPTIIRLLTECLSEKSLEDSCVVMGTPVATGTLIIYGLSAIYAAFGKFKLSFYTAAFALLIVAIVWMLLYNKAVIFAKNENTCEAIHKKHEIHASEDKSAETYNRKIFIFSVCILCFYSVGINLIKDGLTSWVPCILKDSFGMNDSLSILLTLFLPVCAIFANSYALSTHKKIPDYVNHCAIFFAICAVFICIIIASLKLEVALIMLIGLIIVSFFSSALNGLTVSVFPMLTRDKLNSGMCAGLLNGFCYLGSTISSYGLGVIADNYGWTAVFYTLIGVCVIACIICFVYIGIKKAAKISNT